MQRTVIHEGEGFPAGHVRFGSVAPMSTDVGLVPRLRSGSTTQGLLVTLFGDYWFGRRVDIPSAALVDLLGEFGISPQAARAALSRVQRGGFLEGSRDGRNTLYRLSPAIAANAERRGRQIMRFSAETAAGAPPWDGTWTIVTYMLQADQADERRRIRRALRGLGFGPLQDAVWVSPRPLGGRVLDQIGDEPTSSLGVFEHARLTPGADLDVTRVWRLDRLAARYEDIHAQLSEIDRATRRVSGIEPRDALVLRTEAMDHWRTLMPTDPRLPPILLPRAWPGWRARTMFAKVYDRLGPVAAAHVREVVAAHSEAAAEAVRHHVVTPGD